MAYRDPNDPRRAATHKRYEQRYPERRTAQMRKSRLKRYYGLTPEAFEVLVAVQRGRCAICGEIPEGYLYVDHDHATGRVRGLLCINCNTGLGKFKDDIARITAAINYLER